MKKIIFMIILGLSVSAYGAEDLVMQLMDLTRQKLATVKMPDGSSLPPETDVEKKYPIIPVEEAKRFISVGFLSGKAEWCKVEWQKSNFTKLMKYEVSSGKWSQKQISYIALLHGVSMGFVQQRVKKTKVKCSKEQAKQLTEFLTKSK
jgi:hypothetical protein